MSQEIMSPALIWCEACGWFEPHTFVRTKTVKRDGEVFNLLIYKCDCGEERVFGNLPYTEKVIPVNRPGFTARENIKVVDAQGVESLVPSTGYVAWRKPARA